MAVQHFRACGARAVRAGARCKCLVHSWGWNECFDCIWKQHIAHLITPVVRWLARVAGVGNRPRGEHRHLAMCGAECNH